MSRIAGAAAALIAVASCGTLQTSHVMIDWVDFLKWDGVTYVAVPGPPASPLAAGALGGQVGAVKKKVADVVTDPAYRTQDGDAAFLPIGTAIYALRDYRASFRLAVETASIVIYEADTNPGARTGADLMDLEGKLVSVEVKSEATNSSANIDDRATVSTLAGLVLAARVNQSIEPPEGATDTYEITFHFRDGTWSTRRLWASAALLSRGIIVPHEFVQIVTKSLR